MKVTKQSLSLTQRGRFTARCQEWVNAVDTYRVELADRDETGDLDLTAALAEQIERHRFPPGYRRMFLAAIEAFAERGFHATSTRDIASRAGMSPAALYIHFGSKEDVLYRITLSALELTREMVGAVTEGVDAPADRLRALVRALTTWHAVHHAAARVVLHELGALTPEHRTEVLELRRALDRQVAEAIAAGVRTGDFSVPDVGAATIAVLSLCVDTARWYRPGQRRSAREIADWHADAALRIVGAQG